MNEYEKSLMFQYNVLKFILVLAIIFNSILPIYQNSIGLKTFSQYLIIGCYIYGTLNGLGYIRGQNIPIFQLGIIRIVQVLSRYLFINNKILWSFYLFMIVLDIIFLYILYIDKMNYEYIYEEQ